MKIRIFALAKELGMDSKVLIEICNKAGIHLKNSALASITPEERDRVISYINDGGTAVDEPEDDKLVPTREPSREVGGKVRQIEKTGRAAKAETPAAEATVDEPVSEEEPAAQPEPVAEVAAEAAEEAAVAEPAAEPAAETSETETAESETAPAETEQETAVVAEAQTAEDEGEAGEAAETPEEERPAAISREEYVPGHGTFTSTMREMKPIGTVTDNESRRRRKERKESKSALPSVAAPPQMPQVRKKPAKTDESPAQKPVIPLTSELYSKQGPLGARLKSKDEREELEDSRRKKRRTGSLLEQRNRERMNQQQLQSQQQSPRRRTGRRVKRRQSQVELKTSAQIEVPITIRALSEALGRPAKALLAILFKSGRMVTINETVDEEEALMLAMELGVDLEFKRGRDLEQELVEALEAEDEPETLEERPPIVTILGHVDHGKTSLLDRLRRANVAAGEAGGITQHIASYQVTHNDKKITFVDTPGHAAFGEMRSRGANVTDIVVLVVAADDGVMPQTVECISHAKSAGVPIIVAMNKIDLPDVDEQRVLQGLTGQEILPSEWGGDTEVVRTSANTGAGLDELLETILVTAELHEYQANPDRPAVGVCLEAFRDEGRGVLAWMIVQKGTLRVGDMILCGDAYGRVRAMYNDRDEEVEEAGPSTPIKLAGLDAVPGAGDHFFVMSDVEEARQLAEERHEQGRERVLARRGRPRTLEDVLGAAREGEIQDLALIIKADTPGSLEAIRSEINKFEHPEVRVDIIHEGVGGVNESDVYLASASDAIIIAFHVIPEDRAQMLAEQEGVDIRRYDIIYEVTDHIRLALEGLLKPELVRVPTGRALVLQTFHISRYGTIAGCRVLNGTIERNNRCTVIRDQKVLRDYSLASLKREKEDVREVREGMECGIRLDGFNDVKEGDLLEAFRVDEIQRTLEDTEK